MNPPPRKILFLAASGIGNTILATPLIQRVRELWPAAQIDLLTSRRIFQTPLTHSNLTSNFFDLERGAFSTLRQLRGKQYDVSFNCFPSNRWQFNVVAGIIGAKLRVTHRYAEGNPYSFLMNQLVPADDSLHDIEQNLGLLDSFEETSYRPSPPLLFALNADHEQSACEWLERTGLKNTLIIGVHVGGATPGVDHRLMNQQLGAIKSPRAEDLRRDLDEVHSSSALVFFGSAEEDSAIQNFIQSLPKTMRTRCHRFSGDLWKTAALIRKCSYFLSGDTALMHIAAVFCIPQKAYFIVTNPSRTAPRNPNAVLVIETGCASYRYPFTVRSKRRDKN